MILGSSGPPLAGEYGVSSFDMPRVLIRKLSMCFYCYRYIHTHWPTGANARVYRYDVATETTLYNSLWRGECIKLHNLFAFQRDSRLPFRKIIIVNTGMYWLTNGG